MLGPSIAIAMGLTKILHGYLHILQKLSVKLHLFLIILIHNGIDCGF